MEPGYSPSQIDISVPEDSTEDPISPNDFLAAGSIFREIGDRLQTQRESLGLTLNDIEHYTYVRLHYLQTIENGKINELPSPVQGRGMIEIYAKFLGLDADAILLRYADGLQAQGWGGQKFQ